MEKVILRGKEINLTRRDVERVAKEKRIMGNRKTAYFALIEGKKVPVKRLLYEVLKEKGYDFTLQHFTTEDAVRILTKLGIKVMSAKDIGRKEDLLKHAGKIEIGGNAIEDEGKICTP